MEIRAIRTDIFKERQSLVKFIASRIKKLPEGSILVVASKIVALSQGRTANVRNQREKDKLVKSESDSWLRRPNGSIMALKDGLAVSSAGLDESNSNGKIIMLPENSFAVASRIRKRLRHIYEIDNLGIIIVDSRSLPLRAGILGLALGYAGFKGLRMYSRKADIFGRIFKHSRTNVADSLAAAAVLTMGEGSEQQPLALIKEAPVEFCSTVDPNELKIEIKEDSFLYFFQNFTKMKKKRLLS